MEPISIMLTNLVSLHNVFPADSPWTHMGIHKHGFGVDGQSCQWKMAQWFNGIDEAHLPPNAYLWGTPKSAIYAWWEHALYLDELLKAKALNIDFISKEMCFLFSPLNSPFPNSPKFSLHNVEMIFSRTSVTKQSFLKLSTCYPRMDHTWRSSHTCSPVKNFPLIVMH